MAQSQQERANARNMFLKLMGVGSAAAFAITRGYDPEPAQHMALPAFPHPGWTQPEPGTPFIDPAQGGHKLFLLNAIWQHHPLEKMTRRMWHARYVDPQPNTPAKLGDDLRQCMDIAHDVLENSRSIKPPLEAVVEAGIHIYAFVRSSFAPARMKEAFLGSEFSNSDIPLIQRERDTLMKTPQVFPVTIEPGISEANLALRYRGHDRCQHFASHMFLAHAHMRAEVFNLSYKHRMPDSVVNILRMVPSVENKAYTLSRLAGRAWEVFESKEVPTMETMRGQGTGLTTGLWDNFVGLDFQANRLGALAGVALAKPGIRDSDIQHVFDVLNDTAVTQETQNNGFPLTDISSFEARLGT